MVEKKSTEQLYVPIIENVSSIIEPTTEPTIEPTAKPKKKKSKPKETVTRTEFVKISHYDPELLGTNCSNAVNGICVSHMASGKSWEDWMDKAAACPPEWNFGTRFRLPDGRIFECQDRGGAIKYGYDGLTFVDLLTKDPGYKFGEVVEIEILE